MTALECAQLKELWKEPIEDFRAERVVWTRVVRAT